MRNSVSMRGATDRGSAMVAALAVALIGISLATLVVAQAIVVSRDAGRDSVRTAEVHAAEAAVDATLLELESASPCDAAVNDTLLGSGNDAVRIVVEIAYTDQAGDALDCPSGGTIAGTPYGAMVTATGAPEEEFFGLNPERVVRAQVALTPRESTGTSVNNAVYSAVGLDVHANFDLLPSVAGDIGDIWINDGDWTCKHGVSVTGNLYLPQGSANFDNHGCVVLGDLWAQYDWTSSNNKSYNSVEGNVTLRQGNADARFNNTGVGGNVLLGGEVVAGSLQVGGTFEENVVGIPNLAPIDMPDLKYEIAKWTADGFLDRDANDFKAATGLSDECDIGSKTITIPATTQKTVYDLRHCDLETANKGSINLIADTVLYVEAFHGGNKFNVTSVGGAFTLYLIVPSDNTTNGDLIFHANTNVIPPTEIFLYTPKVIEFKNKTTTYGQMYAGEVDLTAHQTFYYAPAELPTDVLVVGAAEDVPGSEVELIFKQEHF